MNLSKASIYLDYVVGGCELNINQRKVDTIIYGLHKGMCMR
jgi:hypothetical protein